MTYFDRREGLYSECFAQHVASCGKARASTDWSDMKVNYI